ncbi:MAG TPA: hypothetical protein V6C52_04475 [Coleofasciculaceae cyanobacterium]|jgi:hypothetical protein
MQGRFKLHMKALLFSATAVGCGFMAAFFFIDGPIRTPHLVAAAEAEAIETVLPATSQPENTTTDQRSHARNIALPSGFRPEWKQLRLDGRIPVEVLARKFSLAQTQDRVGSEYYDYSAFLFEQMATNMPEPELAGRLQTLSLQAQTLGDALRQAAAIRYDGAPSEDMSHLRVRSSIMFHLNDLNPAALVTAQYNQHGKLISQEKSAHAQATGEALDSFLQNAQAVLSDPAAARYPQTMSLVRTERDLLSKLAGHLTLRSESTVYCQQSCDGAASRIRIYVRQTLPEPEIAQLKPAAL